MPFACLFTRPTWHKAQVLLVGVILAPRKRTVAASLRVMGLAQQSDFATYHQVLNRAAWSTFASSRILLGLLLGPSLRGQKFETIIEADASGGMTGEDGGAKGI